MNDERKFDQKRLSYRLPTALLLTAIFFFWAVLRPLDVGHDTALYAETIERYLVPDAARYPDVFFHAIATSIATFSNQIPGGRELSGRFFFVCVALIESVLMVCILRRKKYIVEAILLAISYGPLMFLDIIRQGMSMLLAGVFFSGNRRQPFYLIGALATHAISAIAFLAMPLKKKNLFAYAILLSVAGIFAFLLFDELAARIAWYSRTEGYLADIDSMGFSWDVLSVANLFVIAFFIYAAAVGGFTKLEAFILFILYLVSIFLPLFHRAYLFYFFCLSCSRDVLIDSKRVKYILFNILYAVVVLKFSLNAFYTFGGGSLTRIH